MPCPHLCTLWPCLSSTARGHSAHARKRGHARCVLDRHLPAASKTTATSSALQLCFADNIHHQFGIRTLMPPRVSAGTCNKAATPFLDFRHLNALNCRILSNHVQPPLLAQWAQTCLVNTPQLLLPGCREPNLGRSVQSVLQLLR